MAGKLITVLALAACASLAWGQTPATGAGPLVQLNVVALDSDGKPVGDLTAVDFKVSDQGNSQRVVFLHPNAPAAPAALANELSNRLGGAVPHSTAILFDLLNVSNMIDRLAVWHNLSKWLPLLESGESVYFYLLTVDGTLTPLHAVGGAAGDDKTWHQQFDKLLDKTMKSTGRVRPDCLALNETAALFAG